MQPGGQPRLLEIDGIHVEAPLEGNVIYLRNLDVPGVIGRVGTVLGQHNINIANFSLGRGPESSAVAVVQVDGDVTEAVLDALRGIETILLAKAIRFVGRGRSRQSPRNSSRRNPPPRQIQLGWGQELAYAAFA